MKRLGSGFPKRGIPATLKDLHEILTILESDGRLTAEQIGDMLDRPAGDIEKVIGQAEADGIIRRYKAVVDWDRAGQERLFAFIDVKVTPTRGAGFDDVAERIYKFPEVVSLYLMSGEYDLRVIIQGSTMQEVANFVSNKLATIDRVRSTASHFVLKRYKEDREIFAEKDADHRLAVTP